MKDFKLLLLIANIFVIGTAVGYFMPQDRTVIIYRVDSAGGMMNEIGKITDKEIIEGHYTVTVGDYGKFSVTEEQYQAIAIGDDVPEYLKGRLE